MIPFFYLPPDISSDKVGGDGQWAFFCRSYYSGSTHRRGWAVPRLRSTLYSGSSTCAPILFETSDTICLAFGMLRDNEVIMNRPLQAKITNCCQFLRRVSRHPPRLGPGPPLKGATRIVRLLHRLQGRLGYATFLSARMSTTPSPTPPALGFDSRPYCGP